MDWIQDFSAAVVLCDTKGVITYLNDQAVAMYERFGGRALLGKSVFDCHEQQASNDKMIEIMRTRTPYAYTTERNGIKRLIYQAPHIVNDEAIGIIELAIVIPFEMPHFVRS